MSRPSDVRSLVLGALLVPTTVLACGEGMFITGNSLEYQSYLAPRPATVLIYSPAHGEDSERLHAGLQQAGHSLTVVEDSDALGNALASGQYDVLIADLDRLDSVASSAGTARVLPVVPRALRGSREVRERFDQYLVDGASLGQHLKAINRLVGAP